MCINSTGFFVSLISYSVLCHPRVIHDISGPSPSTWVFRFAPSPVTAIIGRVLSSTHRRYCWLHLSSTSTAALSKLLSVSVVCVAVHNVTDHGAQYAVFIAGHLRFTVTRKFAAGISSREAASATFVGVGRPPGSTTLTHVCFNSPRCSRTPRPKEAREADKRCRLAARWHLAWVASLVQTSRRKFEHGAIDSFTFLSTILHFEVSISSSILCLFAVAEGTFVKVCSCLCGCGFSVEEAKKTEIFVWTEEQCSKV